VLRNIHGVTIYEKSPIIVISVLLNISDLRLNYILLSISKKIITWNSVSKSHNYFLLKSVHEPRSYNKFHLSDDPTISHLLLYCPCLSLRSINIFQVTVPVTSRINF
jgi:hypothetical protein